MQKAPEAFRTISEVADELNLPQHVLRFWEKRFSQIKPMKRGGGRRYYRPEDISLLRGIKHLLYGEGYTIKGVQRILKEQGVHFITDGVKEADALQTPSVASIEVAPKTDPSPSPSPAPSPAPVEPVSAVSHTVAETSVSPAINKEIVETSPAANSAEDTVSIDSGKIANTDNNSAAALASSDSAPFVVTHNVPTHLVDAITTQQSVLEVEPMSEQEAGTTEEWPYDVLPEPNEQESGGTSRARSLLKRVKFGSTETGKEEAGEVNTLSQSHTDRLQETLVDLLECKRLLDQIR